MNVLVDIFIWALAALVVGTIPAAMWAELRRDDYRSRYRGYARRRREALANGRDFSEPPP